MQIKQLEAFVNVIKYKSFSKAAEAIFLSQPSISAYISSLESELDGKLIIRSTKEVYPTDAGRKLYIYANEILKTLERAQAEIKSVQTEVNGVLSIAASTVPSKYLLPDIFSNLLRDYSGLKFKLMQSDSSDTIKHIENMDAELGVVGTEIYDGKCVFEPFIEDKLVLIAPMTEEYITMGSEMPIEKLLNEKFILRTEGSGTLKETEKFFLKNGKPLKNLNTICELSSTESVKQAVYKGLGVSVISYLAACDYERMGRIKIFDLNDETLLRKFYIAYQKDRPLSPAARAFIKEAHNLK